MNENVPGMQTGLPVQEGSAVVAVAGEWRPSVLSVVIPIPVRLPFRQKPMVKYERRIIPVADHMGRMRSGGSDRWTLPSD